ncbi:DNA translocase FtsK 4TM domain-containing protein [Candidatus Azambacteria bacterium]|nr:DNA translocase FtsK 4TM domain-containing protein [Candidatus Azambacteria bacterium]
MAKEKNAAKSGSKSKNGNGKNGEEKKPKFDLHPETKKSVLAVIFFTVAAILVLSYFGYAGRAGAYLYRAVDALLGVGFFLVPLSFAFIGVSLLRTLKTNIYFTSFFGGALFLFSVLGFVDLVARQSVGAPADGVDAVVRETYPAGYVGYAIAYPFVYFFGFWVALLLFVVVALIAISITFNLPLFHRRKDDEEESEEALSEDDEEELETIETIEEWEKEADAGFTAKALASVKEKAQDALEKAGIGARAKEEKQKGSAGASNQQVADFVIEAHQKFYKIPPLDLLEKDTGKPSSGDVEAYSLVIQKTLKHFGIEVEMGEVNVGPTVTQYTLKPAQGIKLSRIIALQNDLSLALAAHPLRIEAPIPGRSLVGIEVPNKSVALVRMRNMIDNAAFAQAPLLTMVLGRDVAGNPQYADIDKMPHLLIAGTTGSGKSVCLHTILTSLLYKNFPQMLKLVIIDPKRIELAAYNGIPHLLTPIIIERDKAIAALRWAAREMERRYEFLAQFKVRNISSYNAQIAKGEHDERIMPYIVIVIDELADLMSSSAKEVEAAIVRLAQMSRAVGIHLIISTQRPSVEVITGLIKANIPCRIAFQVASLVDSRTILDMSGAEKLLGNGDMLFLPPEASKPRRIQGAFVSEKEVKRITDYIRETAESMPLTAGAEPVVDSIEHALEKPHSVAGGNGGWDGEAAEGSDEELLERAKEVIAHAQKASASLLQRRLKLGYARAARIMDLLEEEGCISPQDGAKPRHVFIERPPEAPEEFGNDDEE